MFPKLAPLDRVSSLSECEVRVGSSKRYKLKALLRALGLATLALFLLLFTSNSYTRMKKIGLLVLTIATLSSCKDKYAVQLLNGSKVVATECSNRAYNLGDTVCITRNLSHDWILDEDGNMEDTTFSWTYYDSDSVKRRASQVFKIGVLQGRL